MTYREAVDKITAEHKWYVGKFKHQPNAWRTVRNIREGRASWKTITKFLNKFNYREVEDCVWVKIEDKTERPQLKYS